MRMTTQPMSRRRALGAFAASAAALALRPIWAQTSTPAAMSQAVNDFLGSLDAAQREKTRFDFASDERQNWNWVPRSRRGLPLGEMTTAQRQRVDGLLQAGLSATGAARVPVLISLQNDIRRDPSLYFVTVFGNPGDPRWGWRFEGHHLSINATLVNGRVSMTPLFFGASPTVVTSGPRQGLRAMDREERAGRELLLSLDAATRSRAIFRERALTNLATTTQRSITPLEPVGITVERFSARQRALLNEVIEGYVGAMPTSVAEGYRARVREAAPAQVRFGWAGETVEGRPHYHRVQGPSFLLEFDNSRDSGRHIHSVWREFGGDFGSGLG
jgi:Protein of unknown function (DUF3500)